MKRIPINETTKCYNHKCVNHDTRYGNFCKALRTVEGSAISCKFFKMKKGITNTKIQ